MAVPAYSTRIFVGSIQKTANYVDIATVPAGHRLIVVQITVNWPTATDNALMLTLKYPLFETLRVLQSSTAVEALWEGRIVYHEGETLQLRQLGSSASAGVYVGGYLFSGAGAPMIPGALPA